MWMVSKLKHRILISHTSDFYTLLLLHLHFLIVTCHVRSYVGFFTCGITSSGKKCQSLKVGMRDAQSVPRPVGMSLPECCFLHLPGVIVQA